MILNRVAGPAVEPVTVEEAKAWVRQTEPDDDALFPGLIASARELAENHCKRSFVATTFDLVLEDIPISGGYFNRANRDKQGTPAWFPSASRSVVKFPRAPLLSIVSIGYLDPSGTARTLDPSAYRAIVGTPGQVAPSLTGVWPTLLSAPGALTLRFVAGYGTTAELVPAAAKQAILLTVDHSYRNRGSASVELPTAARSFLNTLAWGAYG